jgi:hypothetical protein
MEAVTLAFHSIAFERLDLAIHKVGSDIDEVVRELRVFPHSDRQ